MTEFCNNEFKEVDILSTKQNKTVKSKFPAFNE